METLQRYRLMSKGVHPVSTGRAPWLTGPFEQAMLLCGTVLGG